MPVYGCEIMNDFIAKLIAKFPDFDQIEDKILWFEKFNRLVSCIEKRIKP